MVEKIDEEFQTEITLIYQRRNYRDRNFLRQGKMVAMRELEWHWKEWIVAETKDLIIITERLKNAKNLVMRGTIRSADKKLREIQVMTARKIISPMKKLGEGNTKSKSEKECLQKLESAVINACKIIHELNDLRVIIEEAITQDVDEEVQEPRRPHYIA